MLKWVLVLCASSNYYKAALRTIEDARTVGKWSGDIVLITNGEIPEIVGVEQLCVHTIGMQTLQGDWLKHNKAFQQYLLHKGLLGSSKECYDIKFHIFSTFFKRWDRVCYVDAGMFIQGPLSRFTSICAESGVLYAHSNAYPTYEWKLNHEFARLDIFGRNLSAIQNLDQDYFQSTFMIFDTSLISNSTVDDLYELAFRFPIAHGDQGLINLMFLQYWKQLPIKDEEGMLYDFWERDPHMKEDYCMLKYVQHGSGWTMRK